MISERHDLITYRVKLRYFSGAIHQWQGEKETMNSTSILRGLYAVPGLRRLLALCTNMERLSRPHRYLPRRVGRKCGFR